ncbi:D-amino-acid oxidase [Cladobotryum mycophilum]|uniref:D-amino-acid oxidase n=1 Tax=Cladobotryum mycophilum TaxID=491253 RepID=A0ABR0T334_9HYPO
MSGKPHIVVIGAGVLGLTCALQLSKQGHHVTVLARELPGDWTVDYASPRAGAHFRPTPTANDQERFENTLMRETFQKFLQLSKEDKDAGVEFVPAVEYFDSTLSEGDVEMFASWPGFRIFDPSELPRGSSIKAGLTYSAWVLNSPVYLSWLQTQAEKCGAVISRQRLSATQEAVFIAAELRSEIAWPSIVINASGMGFNDPDTFPSRGQFILLSNEYDRTISHHASDGHSTVVIPRPLGGGTVIGGTKEPHNW